MLQRATVFGKGLGLVANSFRRYISNAIMPVQRMPLVEELTESIVLNNTDAMTTALLRNYVPPTTALHLEASLSAEFRQHILKTDPKTYEDPILAGEYEQAARLIQYTLAASRNARHRSSRMRTPKSYGLENSIWVKQECNRLYRELISGSRTRWNNPKKLLSGKWDPLTAAQKQAILPAVQQLGRNPHLHPRHKARVLKEIRSVVTRTIQ